ncbi:unnamed protein product [Oikopleura dioica]|uniref:Uncharacterized protein n=1 Tax=Oikopleura dioica TaxID=34765 RepID=E4X1B2_OIKDI|nr:unnamed protein product [Oikopleura dioica]
MGQAPEVPVQSIMDPQQLIQPTPVQPTAIPTPPYQAQPVQQAPYQPLPIQTAQVQPPQVQLPPAQAQLAQNYQQATPALIPQQAPVSQIQQPGYYQQVNCLVYLFYDKPPNAIQQAPAPIQTQPASFNPHATAPPPPQAGGINNSNYNNQQTTQQVNIVQPTSTVVTQPVGFMQGYWTKSLCSTCCDCKTCYAIFCTPCARGEASAKMGGGYCFGCCLRAFCPCISCCMLCDERDRIRARYHIPNDDCCCTCCAVCYCEPCVISQHLYQLERIQFF